MKYFTCELNGEEINLRLTSQDSIKIEETYKTKLLDYIQDYSIKTIVNLLRYMRRGAGDKSFSQDDAEKFFDDLVDSGYAIQTILEDIIMPTCQVSGLLTQSDLQMIRDKKEEMRATQNQSLT